jgi:hypothetical protein
MNTNKLITTLFLLLFLVFDSVGQSSSCVIKGKVIDFDEKKPKENATIYLGKNGVYSDKNGEFTLVIPEIKSSDFLSISYVGYKTTGFTGLNCQNDTIILDSIPIYQKLEVLGEINQPRPSDTKSINKRYFFKEKYYFPVRPPNRINFLFDLSKK